MRDSGTSAVNKALLNTPETTTSNSPPIGSPRSLTDTQAKDKKKEIGVVARPDALLTVPLLPQATDVSTPQESKGSQTNNASEAHVRPRYGLIDCRILW